MATFKITDAAIAKHPWPTKVAQDYIWDTELVGFGVVIGRTGGITFVARGRVNGKRLKVTIGRAGQKTHDGHVWDAELARAEAAVILGGGTAPSTTRKPARPTKVERVTPVKVPPSKVSSKLTLREALMQHLDRMRERKCSELSILVVKGDVERLLASWLDRPLTALTAEVLTKIHQGLTAAGRVGMADTLLNRVSAIWNTAAKNGAVDGENPASTLTLKRNKPVPKRELIGDLATWYRNVQVLSPVRRDLRLFALFANLSIGAAKAIREQDVDWERGALRVTKIRQGKSTTLLVPLGARALGVLRRRIAENASAFEVYDGAGGWIFPAVVKGRVTHVVDCDERWRDAVRLPSQHVSRCEFRHVASDLGIAEITRQVLHNRVGGKHDAAVNCRYVEAHFEDVVKALTRIENELWSRMKLRAAPGQVASLRAA